MQFGITLKPTFRSNASSASLGRRKALDLNSADFDSCLVERAIPALTLMAATKRMGSAHVSLTGDLRSHRDRESVCNFNLISGDGWNLHSRGDSSRRAGKKPVLVATRSGSGGIWRSDWYEAQHDGQPTRLNGQKSRREFDCGYGPKVLHMAGRAADGIILQFADPALIERCMGLKEARAAGRDVSKIEVMAAAPV